MTCTATPFSPLPPEKLAHIIDKCLEHRPWFSDDEWAQPDVVKRAAVIARLADPSTKTWEVWSSGEIVAILLFTQLVEGQDALFHGLAFDRKLKDKRAIVRNVLGEMFRRYRLHAIRADVPTYAHKLLSFTRNALGMRYEAESRAPAWPKNATPLTADEAKLGSRRHHAVKYDGVWHDTLLLSVTADEFVAASAHFDGQAVQSDHDTPPRDGTVASGPGAGVAA